MERKTVIKAATDAGILIASNKNQPGVSLQKIQRFAEILCTRIDLGAINIILEESNSMPDVYFVEIENDKGESISIGERTKRDDAFTSLRIRVEDIINHLAI